MRCPICGMVQLSHTVERDTLYKHYWYKSAVTETMRAALKNVVDDAMYFVNLEDGDHVMDIACNDGELLSNYPTWVRRIGVDPSNVADDAVRTGATIIHDYFPMQRSPLAPVPMKIITAIACFYDLDDPVGFLREVKRWLHPDGLFVLQHQGSEDMLACNGVDNIVHEHLLYPSLEQMRLMLESVGLKIASWSQQPINGGSSRMIVQHAKQVPYQFTGIHPYKRLSPTYLRAFADKAEANKDDLLQFLRIEKQSGKRIYGYAASTKFNTLSQYYGLGPDLITAIGERSPEKIGQYTVTGIPIVSEDEMRAAKPDVLVICAWQFADAFAQRERALLQAGTIMVAPLPYVRIIKAEDAPRRPLVGAVSDSA